MERAAATLATCITMPSWFGIKMERKNMHKDPRIQETIDELTAVKQALIKKGTIKQEDIDNEKKK